MTGTLINASERFSSGSDRAKTSAIDNLRRTVRINLADRALFAARLGEAAARLDPDRPARAAKRWFDLAWQGDRWAKRKRLVILPGETTPDQLNEGAYVASGADWAALIEQAARSQHGGSDPTSTSDRARAIREILRGTAFLPSLAPIPLDGDSAQSLVAAYAERVASLLDKGTELRRLWNVLAAFPFKIRVGLASEKTSLPETLRSAAARAREAAVSRYRIDDTTTFNFEPSPTGDDQDWAHPIVRLGLRGHRRSSRIFVVPREVADNANDDEEVGPEDRISEWLLSEKLIANRPYEDLPEVNYDRAKGFGWRQFEYEIVQLVYLEVLPKPDGTPGLWISARTSDLNHYHPIVPGCDTVALEARSNDGWLGFIGMYIDAMGPPSSYLFVQWPTHDPAFMNGNDLPFGAASGLVEPDDHQFPDIAGWIDDVDNAEVQDLLYGLADDIRFRPSVSVDPHTPSPCGERTVASAFFRNLSVDVEDRIANRLLEQAVGASRAGLAYYEAVVAHHRALIDEIS